jgi:hypothetical protein
LSFKINQQHRKFHFVFWISAFEILVPEMDIESKIALNKATPNPGSNPGFGDLRCGLWPNILKLFGGIGGAFIKGE